MSETVVTLDQLKELIRHERLKPEDLFSAEDLKAMTDQARGEGYAEGVFQRISEDEKDKGPETPEEPSTDNYADPALNPWIKTD